VKPPPTSFVVALLLALCALCAWQWHRESLLRELYVSSQTELAKLRREHDETLVRVKAADAEILRVNQGLTELRANSVSKVEHGELTERNTTLKEGIEKQNAMILEQNASLTKAAASIDQANRNIQALTTQRDELVTKLNATIAEVNARQAKPAAEKR
jgi:predicted  nucleic acid-binding Zn-ribbon protein